MYLFPYKEIEKGSKIIIYGAGKAGMDFYEQMKVSRYADVLCIIDKDYNIWKDSKRIKVPVIGMEDILKYACICDYIIISIRNKIVAEKISMALTKIGIEEELILIPEDFGIHEYIQERNQKCDKVSIVDFLEEDIRNKEFRKFSLFGNGNIGDFFEYLILQIRNLDKNSNVYLKLMDLIVHEENLSYKIIMIHLMIHARCMDSILLKQYMNTVSCIDDLELQYVYLSDIALYSLCFVNSIYPQFYIDLRQKYEQLMKKFNLEISKKDCTQNKCIVIMLYPQAGHEDIINNLILQLKHSYKIYIVFMSIVVPGSHGLFPKSFLKIEDLYYACLDNCENNYRAYGHDANLEYIEGYTVRQRLQMALNKIFDINPEMIVDMTDEQMPLSYLLVQHYPILNIPIRGFKSSMFFTKIIVEGKKAALYANAQYASIKEDQMLECYLGIPNQLPMRSWNREEFGWKSDDFVLLTVGTRLEYEMSEDFMSAICDWMEKDEEVKWLIIGIEYLDYMKKREKLITNGQVILAGYQNDFAGICQCGDVYMNPLRTGGGVSQIVAIYNGVPVLADASVCFDAMEYLGWDNLCWSLEEQLFKAKKMKKDEKYRQNEIKKMQKAVRIIQKKSENNLLEKECRQMILEWKKGVF